MLLLHLAAAPSVLAVYATAAACGIALVQLGDAGPSAGLIQCERTLCVAAGRWQCTAAHRLWRLECPRQQCWSLTCVLGPQQTAAVATAAACCCLIQSSQRCSEACRIRAVWYLLRLSAFRPGDRSWMVRWSSASSIEPSMAGRRSVRWRAERCTARPKKHGSDDCHKTSDLRHPGLDLVPTASASFSARCSRCRSAERVIAGVGGAGPSKDNNTISPLGLLLQTEKHYR